MQTELNKDRQIIFFYLRTTNIKTMGKLKGWKTILFNIIMAILLVVDQQADIWGIPPGVVETIIIVGNFILRFLTDGPVFNREK